jgi:hypothetical protein
MPKVTRLALDALTTMLADATTGFNAQLAAIAPDYGITPFTLDFSPGSVNVVWAAYSPDTILVSEIIQFPGFALFTTESEEKHKIINSRFAGTVTAHAIAFLHFAALDAPATPGSTPDYSNDLEKYPDAVSDAFLEALNTGRPLAKPMRVNHSGFQESRDLLIPTGDGHVQIITFNLTFEVYA